MNSTTIDRSMNGIITLTDGELSIEGGSITFPDGSVLDSITDIPLLSGNNTFTGGSNTFNNNIIAPTAPILTTNLTNKAYVDDSIATSITNLKTANNTFTGVNTISNTTASTNSTTGALVVAGGIGVDGIINSNNGFVVNTTAFPNNWYNGIFKGTTDGATATNYNLAIKSWYGIGFVYNNIGVNPSQLASIFMDVREGQITGNKLNLVSTLDVSGISIFRNDLSITGELTTNKSINNTRIKTNVYNNQTTIVIDASQSNITNLMSSGMENFVFGKSNLTAYTTGTHNVSIGLENLQAITTGSYNTAVGCNVLPLATSQFNIGIGEQVLKITTTGEYNVGIGYNSLTENITGTNNIGIGYWSGRYSTGNYNTFIGDQTKTDNLAGYNNSTAVGAGATITASYQVVLGVAEASYFTVIPSTKASTSLTTGAFVVSGGVGIAGNLNIGGNVNSLKLLGKSDGLIISGSNSVVKNISLLGTHDYIIGDNIFLLSPITSVYNIGIGHDIGRVFTSGNFNVSIGVNNLTAATSQDLSVSIGHRALSFTSSGSDNVGIGYLSGKIDTELGTFTGNFNTFLGAQTQVISGLASCSASTAVGYGAKITATNQIVLGRTSEYVSIPSTTASTSPTTGALVVAGGVGIGGNISLTAGKTIRWATGNVAVESYYADDDRYGLSYNGGIVRLHTSNFYAPSSIRFSLATGSSTYTDLMTISHNGDTTITGNVIIGQKLTINNEPLYFKASTGTSKLLKDPLYTWSFTANANTTYTLDLSAQGLSNYLGYPYEIRVMFFLTGDIIYPVYNITNQSIVYDFNCGYQITYTDSNTLKLRTGDTHVAMIYNHTSSAYQYQTTGTYFVFIYA